MDLDGFLKIGQIIAAVFVGGAAVWVSLLQYNTNKMKLKLAMYDRRKTILQVTQQYLNDFLNSRDFDLNVAIKFRWDTADSKFLFGSDVNDKMDELFKSGLKLDLVNGERNEKLKGRNIKGNPSQDKLKLIRKISVDYDSILRLFRPYLDLSKAK